jgi:hypothetical protein
LSGCSFRRKLRPRKYDDGIARDSESSDFRSTRAAIQPMPKNTGRARSHQNSNSMEIRWRHRHPRRRGIGRRGHRGERCGLAAQLADLAALAHHGGIHASNPITTPPTNATRRTKTSGAFQDWPGSPKSSISWPFFTANHTRRTTMRNRTIQTRGCMGKSARESSLL